MCHSFLHVTLAQEVLEVRMQLTLQQRQRLADFLTVPLVCLAI